MRLSHSLSLSRSRSLRLFLKLDHYYQHSDNDHISQMQTYSKCAPRRSARCFPFHMQRLYFIIAQRDYIKLFGMVGRCFSLQKANSHHFLCSSTPSGHHPLNGSSRCRRRRCRRLLLQFRAMPPPTVCVCVLHYLHTFSIFHRCCYSAFVPFAFSTNDNDRYYIYIYRRAKMVISPQTFSINPVSFRLQKHIASVFGWVFGE